MVKKNLCLTSLIFLISLSSCFYSGKSSSVDLDEEEVSYSYRDFPSEKAITIDELFNQEEDFYMVYCYSPGCHFCTSFYSYIVPYFLDNPTVPLYHLNISTIGKQYFQDDENLDNTIGATSLEEMYFYTTPGLVGFKEWTVIFNVYGKSEIKAILDSFISS